MKDITSDVRADYTDTNNLIEAISILIGQKVGLEANGKCQHNLIEP